MSRISDSTKRHAAKSRYILSPPQLSGAAEVSAIDAPVRRRRSSRADGSRVTAARQRPKVYSLVTRGGGESAPNIERGVPPWLISPKKMGQRPDAIPAENSGGPPGEAEIENRQISCHFGAPARRPWGASQVDRYDFCFASGGPPPDLRTTPLADQYRI